MKTTILGLALLWSLLSFAQSTLIPDSNFEQALIDMNIDSDGLNGSILNSDAQSIWSLDVSNRNINDLTGIEAFTGLTDYLDCSYNNLQSLDLTSNISLVGVIANNNQLTTINVSGLTSLYALNVQDNNLDSLDFSSNLSLYQLYCFRNELTHINVSNNYNLGVYSCGDNNLSGLLDISNNFQLEFLDCGRNSLDSIDIWQLPNVTIFNCQKNSIEHLDLTSASSLEQLYVDSNDLKILNVRNGYIINILDFHAEGNPNLFCIQVDDAQWSSSSPDWIEDTQSFYSEDCSSFALIKENGFSISLMPNPCTLSFKVSLENAGFHTYRILTSDGKVIRSGVFHGKNKKFKTDLFSDGIYLLEIDDATRRFVVSGKVL